MAVGIQVQSPRDKILGLYGLARGGGSTMRTEQEPPGKTIGGGLMSGVGGAAAGYELSGHWIGAAAGGVGGLVSYFTS